MFETGLLSVTNSETGSKGSVRASDETLDPLTIFQIRSFPYLEAKSINKCKLSTYKTYSGM